MAKHNRKLPNITLNNNQVPTIPNQLIASPDFVFRSYYKWLNSIKDKNEFTNFSRSADDYAKLITEIVHTTIPLIYKYSTDIFINGKAKSTPLGHSHLLKDDALITAKSLAGLITTKPFDEHLTSWWQIGGSQGVRIIGVYVTSAATFYPLFIDCHHLLSPNKYYNQADVKSYSYIVQ